MYTIGFDIGSSSIKAALVHQSSGETILVVQEPTLEMPILSDQPNFAEQDPGLWWNNVCTASGRIIVESGVEPSQIKAIGISYQMHGLVLLNANGDLLRNAIIWCDSRAVSYGNDALVGLGEDFCRSNLLNSPGNFTASKLKWVKENEPEIYAQIAYFMLPGDYIAYKLTGVLATTKSGLSEGILWNYKTQKLATAVLDFYQINANLVPNLVENFTNQGNLSAEAVHQTGLTIEATLRYRAGDQPNNALALNVMQEGEVALSAGTSGVVYAVHTQNKPKEIAKINHFVHVNYSSQQPFIGTLLNINGVGAQYRWLKEVCGAVSYDQMHEKASEVAIGSDGVIVIPFGNGAERMFSNRTLGTQLLHLNVNRHDQRHLIRATLEGIAFSFVYGLEILQEQDIPLRTFRAGNDNLFQAQIFSETLATLIDQELEIYETTGAVGAAIAAGFDNTMLNSKTTPETNPNYSHTVHPNSKKAAYQNAYARWKAALNIILKNTTHE